VDVRVRLGRLERRRDDDSEWLTRKERKTKRVSWRDETREEPEVGSLGHLRYSGTSPTKIDRSIPIVEEGESRKGVQG